MSEQTYDIPLTVLEIYTLVDLMGQMVPVTYPWTIAEKFDVALKEAGE